MTLQQLRYAVAIADSSSMNEAARKLYISQPSLSGAIRDLEKELGISIFLRSNRGIVLTQDGEGFLSYARQMMEEYQMIQEHYIEPDHHKTRFGVSMQHYSFAVRAFIRLAGTYKPEDYEFALHETKTHEVIEHVSNMKSEIGILYLNAFNRRMLEKAFADAEVEFHRLFECRISVYLRKGHPLAERRQITMEDLEPYPCLSFDQGDNNSFYYAEEVNSTYGYHKIIHADDRATMLNLMVGLDAYTLCCGIICEDLNGPDYVAIPLKSREIITIGYIKRKRMPPSRLGEQYVEILRETIHGDEKRPGVTDDRKKL